MGFLYGAQITSGGECAKIISTGDYAQITSSGESAKITSTGNDAQITSSGDEAKIISTGFCSQIMSYGFGVEITSNRRFAKITSNGENAKINSSGEYSQITSGGECAKIISTGDYAQITSNGEIAKIISNGNLAHIISSGYNAEINITGKESIVFVLGRYSMVKAKNGTWITMCEYREDYSIFTLSVQIGNEEYKDYQGRTLNENEYYCLYNKKIYPVDICDGINTIKISEKKKDGITIIKGQDLYEYERIIYIVKDNDISAHGATLRKAIEDFNFKKLKREGKEKIIKEIRESGKVNKPQYRAITGACEFGVNEFCKKHNITVEEISLEELRKILVDDYGALMFWTLIDGKDTSHYIDDLPF